MFKIQLLGILLCLSACNLSKIQSSKNIPYINEGNEYSLPIKELNIFSPKKADNAKVIVFAYGGSWQSGRKELYGFLGRKLARRGFVAVLIDYPLAPQFKIQQMALSVAQAINWTYDNIDTYGGDQHRIYVAGHSAGGHLMTLNTLKSTFFDSLKVENPIKGAIMIDAAGLDMYNYLKETKLPSGTSYLQAFTNDPSIWKAYSPIYYLNHNDPKIMMLLGENTYPGIKSSSAAFLKKANQISFKIDFHLQKHKRHIPMITQFIWPWNDVYTWIDQFTDK